MIFFSLFSLLLLYIIRAKGGKSFTAELVDFSPDNILFFHPFFPFHNFECERANIYINVFFSIYTNRNEFNWRKNRFMWNIFRLLKTLENQAILSFVVHANHKFRLWILFSSSPILLKLKWTLDMLHRISIINIYNMCRQPTNNSLIEFHWI